MIANFTYSEIKILWTYIQKQNLYVFTKSTHPDIIIMELKNLLKTAPEILISYLIIDCLHSRAKYGYSGTEDYNNRLVIFNYNFYTEMIQKLIYQRRLCQRNLSSV